MSMNVGDLFATIRADDRPIRQSISNIEKSFKGLASTATAYLAFQGFSFIAQQAKESVKAYNDLSSAQLGLSATLQAQGRDVGVAKSFLSDYTKDGLVPMTDAVSSFKMLASRGYDDTQIKNVMTALKDASAFGRQSALSMGEAVRSASEGLKAENSVLVDNAGVTKNVAKMWEEYAKKIGVSYNQLTQAQKIQAEVNGIMAETAFQAGNAGLYAQTLGGKMTALSARVLDLKVAFGNFLAPVIEALLPLLTSLATALTYALNVGAQFMRTLFGVKSTGEDLAKVSVKMSNEAMAGADAQKKMGDATKKAGKDAKGSVASFDEVNELMEATADNADKAGDAVADAGGGNTGASMSSEKETKSTVDTSAFEGITKALQPTIEALGRLQTALQPLKDFTFQAMKDWYNLFLKPVGTWVMGEGLPRFIDAITKNLGTIDFPKINESLKAFYGALAPFAINIGEGLLWFWENVLLPIGAWTGGKLLPAFLDLLTASLDLLNTTIESIKPELKWFWEEFLKPFGIWAGDTVIKAINSITNEVKWLNNELKSLKSDNSATTTSIGDVWESLKGTLKAIWDFIVSLAKSIWNELLYFWYTWGEDIKKFTREAWEDIKFIIKTVLDVITWIFKIFKALLEEDVDQLWAWIGDATKAFWEAFKSDVDNDLTYIKNLFLDAWNYVWYDVLMPYYDWLYETFKPIFDTISEAFTVAVTGIKTLFSTDWEEIKGYMLVVFDWINENLLGIFDKVNTAFKTALDLINSKIKTVWDDIKGFIKPVHDYINDTVMGVFDKVKTALEKAWGAMPTFVKTTWDNILEFIKGGINTVIEAVNSFIRRINGIKISIPSVDIPGVGKVGGGEIAFKLPELQKLARGGIVSSPTIAQIGEKGAEAVVPLQNTSFLDALAGSIGNAVLGAMQFSQGMGGQTTQGNGNIILQVDGVQLARVLMPAMTKETNRIGNVIIQGV